MEHRVKSVELAVPHIWCDLNTEAAIPPEPTHQSARLIINLGVRKCLLLFECFYYICLKNFGCGVLYVDLLYIIFRCAPVE